MNVHLAVGGEVDLASGEELQNAVKDLKSDIARVMPVKDPKPVRRKLVLARQSTGPAGYDNTATPQILTADGAILSPSVGRVWDVRSVSVFQFAQPSSGLGTASGYSINGGDPNLPSPIDVKPGAHLTTISNTFTKTSVLINPNEELYIVVQNPSALKFVGIVEVDEYPDSCFEAQGI